MGAKVAFAIILQFNFLVLATLELLFYSWQLIDMVDTKEIILEWAVPILGGIIASILYWSPLSAVRQADITSKIGDLNPIPFAMMIVYCTMWVIYGLALKSPHVYFVCITNLIGVITGFYFYGICYPLASEKDRKVMFRILNTLVGGYLPFAFFVYTSTSDKESFAFIVGLVAMVGQVAFFASPLTRLFLILKSRNAASIHSGLAIAGTMNAFLWATFGLVITDWFIFVPNFCSLILGVTQVLLKLFIGNKETEIIDEVDKNTDKSALVEGA